MTNAKSRRTNPAYPLICEVREARDLKAVAELLNSGEWIAICAAPDANNADSYLFSLGRVC